MSESAIALGILVVVSQPGPALARPRALAVTVSVTFESDSLRRQAGRPGVPLPPLTARLLDRHRHGDHDIDSDSGGKGPGPGTFHFAVRTHLVTRNTPALRDVISSDQQFQI